ncbi:c-type cytochrome [Falsirhodobacter halotolerans]|uniref:c-type cytochrome n=1 Tax=Falsirhodobacter halotolerans TaxID=1146892 RepID=UPI001FD62D91|nr:cytochrome c family protein [Falsirhodobacter halotolerans]MCJ8140501.1 cytochrome c family protein [Falsirhodobacter halotolerans]
MGWGRPAGLIAGTGGALAVLVLLRVGAGALYAPHPAPQDPGPATAPAGAAPPTDTTATETTPTGAPDLPAGDAAAGRVVFNRCAACHAIDGPNRIGPHLDGVVGREKASVPDFAYSPALRAMAGQVWTPEALDAFLRNVRGYAPGTKMAFAGIASAQDRADLIAYLQSAP